MRLLYTFFGASVASYKTNGIEWLGMRDDTVFDGAKPIGGGLPLCFPQFGPGKMRQHGFARDLPWRVLEDETRDGVCVLELTDNEETRAMWPHAFRCVYRVELQDGRLSTVFTVENTSNAAFSFQAGLHSYYAVKDAKMCTVTGTFAGAEKSTRPLIRTSTLRGHRTLCRSPNSQRKFTSMYFLAPQWSVTLRKETQSLKMVRAGAMQ